MDDSETPPSILSKAFDLLHAFNSNERVMTLTELSEASGLAKSTVHRLLARLIELGAVEHHRAGYKIGLEIFRLGVTTPAAGMRDAAVPYLAALHQRTGQTVHLAVLRQFDIIYLERLASGGPPSTLFGVGSRLPANCTATGKALLAHEELEDLKSFLPQPMPRMTAASVSDVHTLLIELAGIRRGALARERGEAQPGLACTAAPVIVNGFAIGAVSISQRSAASFEPKYDAALRETAVHVARDIQAKLAEGRSQWFPKDV
jgi:DNA-binding IclR family transcriptional regulator